MYKVFVDGKEGTTGLRIFDRLSDRTDIELITIDSALRKNTDERARLINAADVVFLCLPDDAARESVSFVRGDDVKIIDTSTAHRTNSGWSYGFPELSLNHRQGIAGGKRTAVPGCHACGFISLVYPLVKSGVLPADYPFTCFSATGYSGGGRKMINEYESEKDSSLSSPGLYATAQKHKHLKEMKAVTGIENYPIFCPVVSNYYSGMTVTVPVFVSMLKRGAGPETIAEIYGEHYADSKLIASKGYTEENVTEYANRLSGKDTMEISVYGNKERILLVSSFDNLGKGASGAAVQCMNLMLGFDETEGLSL
ncbi:MAG: N-acetyl-gamma-glutamyl-phosphate reductase [Clostridiales bacterium]|nr:N-acetyl-gamma-glutamyl-phosphate reductase [Clostridiales bacterium]